ncbi:MAG: nucleoside hydrolase [Patescibacteria group bacterium]|nr:nucleoside hydrolase [Patescibacteria group bacterium]
MVEEKNKIIIDTDPGHDDAMALLMLFAVPQIEILAITTVAGNSTIENTTRNAKYILNLAKKEHIPLYAGASKPIERDLIKANVHGISGLDGSGAESLPLEPTIDEASDKIIEIVKQDPKEITLLTLGPLTNIAKAFLKDPSLPKMIKQVIIMGGAITVPGNKNRVAEFNFFVDPEAAKIIFDSEVEKVLIPLDACNDIILPENAIREIGQSGLIGKTLSKMLIPYIENLKKFDGIAGALMYDPLAAYYLINPDAFQLEEMDIKIETNGEYTFGMSVAERRIAASKNPNVKVAVKIDGQKFIEDFINLIFRLNKR